MSGRAAIDEPAHYLGHRARLRERLLQAGAEAVADYELVELVLFRAIPRRDVKPLAKALIARFGSFAEAIAAEPARLAEIEGMSQGAIAEFKIVEAGAKRFAKGVARKRLPVGSFSAVVDYCRTAMAFDAREEFRVLFLDRKNGLIGRKSGRRHGRSDAGLPARSRASRARIIGDRGHPRPQSSVRRSDPVRPRRQDDARHHRRRPAAWRGRPRSHHRRPRRPREFEGPAADLTGASGAQCSTNCALTVRISAGPTSRTWATRTE